MNSLEMWPANSPDLSPIEDLWAIVQAKLQEKSYKTLDELKLALVKIWNRIPITLCRKLIRSFNKRISQVYKTRGKRFTRKYTKVNGKKAVELSWNRCWNTNDDVERIIFSDKTLQETKSKVERAMKRRITREKNDFKKNVACKYTPSFIKSLKMSYSRSIKYEEQGNKLKEAHQKKLKDLTTEWRDLVNMSLDDYYLSFNDEQRLKLINERSTKLLPPELMPDEASTHADNSVDDGTDSDLSELSDN